MEENSNSPPDQGPDEPKILRGGEEVNDDEQNIHSNIDREMDVKPDLRLYPLPRPLVDLVFFHTFPPTTSHFDFKMKPGITALV